MRRTVILALAVLMLSSPLVGGRPPARAAEVDATSTGTLARYGGFAGSYNVLWESDADLKRDLDRMENAGARWLRFDFDWPSAEPQRGVFHWKAIDRAVFAAEGHHLNVIANVAYTPAWARPGTNSDKFPPRNPKDFGDF